METMETPYLCLPTRIKHAVQEGRLPPQFKVRDVDRWREEVDPRKRNGKPFTKDSATLLSNATVRALGARPTKNRNEKFLRRTKDENGERVYELDLDKTR